MFNLNSSQDFYAMLIEDFDDFMAEPTSVRRALHCAITAYHLHEWVWGDWLKTDQTVQKALGINNKKNFIAWIDNASPWFCVIQNLANGTKHFIRNQDFKTTEIQGYGQGPYDVGPYGKGYLLIDFGVNSEPQFRSAAQLLEVIVKFWRDFFKTYRPSIDLPISKHHVD